MKIFVPIKRPLSKKTLQFLKEYEWLPKEGKDYVEEEIGKLLWKEIDKQVARKLKSK